MPTPAELAWLQVFGPAVVFAGTLFYAQLRGHLIPKRIYERALADVDKSYDATNTALEAASQNARAVETLTATVASLVRNSEEQLALQRRTLALLERQAPTDRSAA